MKKLFLAMALMAAMLPLRAVGQITWDPTHMAWLKANIHNDFYQPLYDSLLVQADACMEAKAPSVMQKRHTPASGDKHDYMSMARYYWPDPTKPGGLPYTDRDGESNPELDEYDRNRLGEMVQRVNTLTLAWYLSGDEKYSRQAVTTLRTWFLDKATRMNPNLNYAQMVPGRDGGRGRMSGVLDGYSFISMLNSVKLLEQSPSLTKADTRGLKAWFRQLLKWIRTSELGKAEYNTKNNHAVVCDEQIIAYSIYTGDTELARQMIGSFAERRTFPQIEPDGRQPAELRRTLAFGYSVYNMSHFVEIYMMGRNIGLSVDKATSQDGRSFYKAMDFLKPYAAKEDRQAWPYKQIGEWDIRQQELAHDMYITARYLDPTRTDYMRAFRRGRVVDPCDLFYLVYYEPTAEDIALSRASRQLLTAIGCNDKAAALSENMEKGRVEPRTVNADGSLRLVGPRDWCSGFFPGSLWLMYDYTHNELFRENAVSYTWKVESAKNYRGTHDLGFIFNCSFGNAYRLTGEQSYRDVLLRAAHTLCTRFNPTVGCIRSWDHNASVWQFPVIIDNMMNLEMLFEATRLTGDSSFYKIAVAHANTTLRNHFRPDGSSYHVVDYDPKTGAVRMRVTAQGYSDDSYWSRGQGWGLYGFTMCYRYTRDSRYLDQARRIARFLFSLKDTPDDGIFYWDMKDPAIPDAPRDASAAAIVASALYELCGYVDAAEAQNYKAYADRIVNSLARLYQAPEGSTQGFLLLHSVGHKPAGTEVDVPLSYADYYYLEALLRKQRVEEQTGR